MIYLLVLALSVFFVGSGVYFLGERLYYDKSFRKQFVLAVSKCCVVITIGLAVFWLIMNVF